MLGNLHKLTGVVVAALIMLLPVPVAWADGPQRFVVFGDSLSDPGNAFVLLKKLEVPPFPSLIPDAPYARGALHFSNGSTWVEQLSWAEHALPSAGPALALPRVFSNYAVGGARAGGSGSFDLSGQVNAFLKDFRVQAPDALYVVWLGGNDVRDALQAFAGGRPDIAASILSQAVASIYTNLFTLYQSGARRFLVPNAPDIGLAPAVRLQGLGAQNLASYLASQFNLALEGMLQSLEATPGVRVVRLDVFTILDEIVANPAAQSLTDATDACIQINTRTDAFCPRPDQYLFWDGIHPTVAGHRILARRAQAALDAVQEAAH